MRIGQRQMAVRVWSAFWDGGFIGEQVAVVLVAKVGSKPKVVCDLAYRLYTRESGKVRPGGVILQCVRGELAGGRAIRLGEDST